jgi:ABC-type tungstate transport system substrate-binding protein
VLLATMSSPFGVLLVPIAVLRAFVFLRNRGTVIPLAALAGFSIQTFIMATTSGRKSYDTVLVGKLIHLFVYGVAGQGFFGTRYHVAWSILGAVVVLLVGVVWVLVALMGSWRQLPSRRCH